MSVSLWDVDKGNDECVGELEKTVFAAEKTWKGEGRGGGVGGGAMNTTKHLWAGVVAAMVSRLRAIPFFLLELIFLLVSSCGYFQITFA